MYYHLIYKKAIKKLISYRISEANIWKKFADNTFINATMIIILNKNFIKDSFMKVIFIVDNFNTRKIEYDKNNSIMFIKKQKNQNTFTIKIKMIF